LLLPTKEDEQELIDVPLAARENSGKPVVVILTEETTDVNKLDFEADRRRLRDYYLAHGIPVYSTLERAIRALAHLAEYSRYIQE
jgi:acyl-CoA synthetase (NDP forming)